MKLLNKIVLVSALLCSPFFATHAAQNNDRMGMSTGMGMGMKVITAEQLSLMQQHMNKMATLLAKVKQETDQDKREALLAEHAENMEKMMAVMNSGSSSKDRDGKMMVDHEAMTPDAHLKMLEQRMAMMEGMMEGMMGQMMGHTVEKSK
ncbi:hypothetical protein [Paraglaciecola sp. 25GB23A]|uniref:hypothetical protein n=1 Tax=Paraglaciecola sp. 25GB23A TaxID=3156068 RepID=UPI0032AED405